MDPDLDAKQLATFGDPEIEIAPDCDVVAVWNALFDRDSRSPPTFDDVEIKFLMCMRFAISSSPKCVCNCCGFRGACSSDFFLMRVVYHHHRCTSDST